MNHEYAQAAVDEGQRLCEQRRWTELQELLAVAIEQFPENGRLRELQGLAEHARQRFASALAALEMASLLVPLSIDAQLAMAAAYRATGKPEDARSILGYLASRQDLSTRVLPRLAAQLGQLGEYQRALEVCRVASERMPERDESYYGMAFYMIRLRYPLECILPLLRYAISLAPRCRLYRVTLVNLCSIAGRWSEAYEAACGLPVADVTCLNCLNKLLAVFVQVRDHQRRDACLAQLLKIERWRNSGDSLAAEPGLAISQEETE